MCMYACFSFPLWKSSLYCPTSWLVPLVIPKGAPRLLCNTDFFWCMMSMLCFPAQWWEFLSFSFTCSTRVKSAGCWVCCRLMFLPTTTWSGDWMCRCVCVCTLSYIHFSTFQKIFCWIKWQWKLLRVKKNKTKTGWFLNDWQIKEWIICPSLLMIMSGDPCVSLSTHVGFFVFLWISFWDSPALEKPHCYQWECVEALLIIDELLLETKPQTDRETLCDKNWMLC